MRILKIAIFLLLITLSFFGKSQSIKLVSSTEIETRYRFEDDTSLLNLLQRWCLLANYELTFNGSHELPLIPELKTVKAVEFREAVVNALSSYKNYNLNVVMQANIDDKKKQLYLSTSMQNQQAMAQNQAQTPVEGFSVAEADKSMIQVIVGWATQAGYQSYINNQVVNLQVFPRHVSRYPDYSLINAAKTFKTQSKLKDAISQFIAMYSGISLEPFTITVDEFTKRLQIVSLVKQ